MRVRTVVSAAIAVAVSGLVALASIGMQGQEKARIAALDAAAAAGDPVRFARALGPRIEAVLQPARNPVTGLIDKVETLTIRIDLEPVPSGNRAAREAFGRRVAELVPAVLDRFPSVEYVDVRGTARMVDVRGRESVEEVLRAGFHRPDVGDVNWPKVRPENVFALANLAAIHPRLRD